RRILASSLILTYSSSLHPLLCNDTLTPQIYTLSLHDALPISKINPSNNNGKFTFGKGMYEFNIKFDVANNNVARIYNDYQLQVSRIKNCHNLFHNVEQLDFKKLDFSNRFRRYSTDDLAIVVNKIGKYALLVFKKIESERHGADSDIIEFKWKII